MLGNTRSCRYCDEPLRLGDGVGAATIPPCEHLVSFKQVCGHVVTDVACSVAFEWAADPDTIPPCNEIVDVINPLCRHGMRVACSVREGMEQWQPWASAVGDGEVNGPPQGSFGLITSGFDTDGEAQTMSVLNEKAIVVLPTLDHGCGVHADCQAHVLLAKKCGHKLPLRCIDAFRALGAQCEEMDSVRCPECDRDTQYPCHVAEGIKAGALPRVCKLMVPKPCSKPQCRNVVEAECFRAGVECKKPTSMTLPCGHRFGWHCGEEHPPDDPPCIECHLPAWDKQVAETASLLDMKGKAGGLTEATEFELRQRLSVTVVQCIAAELPHHEWAESPQLCDKLKGVKTRKLLQGQKEVLEKYRDLLKQQLGHTVGADAALVVPVVPPPDIFAEQSYDVVFSQLNKEEAKRDLNTIWSPNSTPYGNGMELSLLCADTVNRCMPNDEGKVRLLLGVAFRLRVHEALPPFLPPGIKANQKVRKDVNKKKAALVNMGFDCVDVGGGEPVADDGNAQQKRVYWHSTALPLKVVDVTIKQPCMICQEQFFAKEGLLCAKRHFVCAECLEGYVASASDPEAVGRTTDEKGNVRCPSTDGCDEFYSIIDLAQQPGAEAAKGTIEKLVELRSEFRVKQEMPEAIEAERVRLQAQFDEIMRIQDEDKRKAELIRLEITSEILNLKCPAPNCGAVFADFDGCFALTCARCKAGFCAWCLEHCGNDAHAHCLQVHGSYYGTREQFVESQRVRRQDMVRQRLSRENARTQELVRELMWKDLDDLGIHI
jgi:hypothetical protein